MLLMHAVQLSLYEVSVLYFLSSNFLLDKYGSSFSSLGDCVSALLTTNVCPFAMAVKAHFLKNLFHCHIFCWNTFSYKSIPFFFFLQRKDIGTRFLIMQPRVNAVTFFVFLCFCFWTNTLNASGIGHGCGCSKW